MKIDLTDEAQEYGRQVVRALESAGGDELVQRAEREPAGRADLVEKVLTELGAWDLDVRSSVDELEAAASVCHAAGWWALPYPVAARIARPDDLDVDGLFVVANHAPAAPLDGLDGRWAAVTLDGRRLAAVPRPASLPPRKSAFVTDVELTPLDDSGGADVALALVLPCWTLLGMLDRAMAVTRQYVLERQQFGQPLARFQSVQFQLTDAEVERAGVAELARYALWSIEAGKAEALDDALALRLAAVEAAEIVFRVCHQLHGAIGFCDETTISWLSRYSQPLRRLPYGPGGTREALVKQIGRRGLTGLFSTAGEGA